MSRGSEHDNAQDRNQVVEWAQSVLATPNQWVILDTETTGLGKDDVVIQIGIIDLNRNTLMDTLVRPTKKNRIPVDATSIHGITMNMLVSAPTFSEILYTLMAIIRTKRAIIYNAEFDVRLLNQTARQDGITVPDGLLLPSYECAMTYYAQFVGQWSDHYQNYVYQKLPSSVHNAIGDCRATLEIINIMAGKKCS